MGSMQFALNLLTGKRSLADARNALAYRAQLRRRLVHLELTSKCNTSCKACYRAGELREYMDTTRTMSVDRLAEVLAHYDPNEIRSFALSGGENLLHPDFFTMVGMIRERFPSQDIQLFSNGLVLAKDRQLLDALCDAPIDSIQFSLHGATQETVSALQPGMSLQDSLETMTYVVENSDIWVSVNFVIQEENIDEMLDFLDLISGTPVKSVLLTPMNYAGHREDPVDYEVLWHKIGLREKWAAASERASELGLSLTRLRDLCGCMDPVDVLTADGSMLLCWGNYLVKKYAVGNVFAERPEDLRKKPEVVRLRRALKAGRKPSMCSACWIQGYDL